MREQSAWLPPATPRARREEKTVGAQRGGPAAAAASQRGPCSRARERFPQPRPPLLTPPQQSADGAATEGAGSPRRQLAPSAQSPSRRRAGGPAAAGGCAPPGAAAAVAAAGLAPAPGLSEGACGAGTTAGARLLAGPRTRSQRSLLAAAPRVLDGLLLLAPADGGLENSAQFLSF